MTYLRLKALNRWTSYYGTSYETQRHKEHRGTRFQFRDFLAGAAREELLGEY
jgi:hypothetical protein